MMPTIVQHWSWKVSNKPQRPRCGGLINRKENRPEVGDYHIITKWDGTPVAVIPFGQVGAGFAHAEGEGDQSLVQWQEVHRAYYAREIGCEARDITDDFAVVCHHFQTVFCA